MAVVAAVSSKEEPEASYRFVRRIVHVYRNIMKYSFMAFWICILRYTCNYMYIIYSTYIYIYYMYVFVR